MAEVRGSQVIHKDQEVKGDLTLKFDGATLTAGHVLVLDDTAGLVGTSDISSVTTGLQTEVDAIEVSAGTMIGTDGTYTAPSGTNYIDAATSMTNAIELLDIELADNRLDGVETVSIAAGSSAFISASKTGNNVELSVSNLLVTSVTVDAAETSLANWVATNYTVGNELQEGDVLVLSNASVTDGETTWIHNGGTAVSAADFSPVSDPVSQATIRAALVGGSALTYTSASGTFDVNVDDSSIEVSSDALQLKADGVKDSHVDWGTGAGQVSAVDLPIEDTGSLITATEVEGALAELATDIATLDASVKEFSDTFTAVSSGTTYNTTGKYYDVTHNFALGASDHWKVNFNCFYYDGTNPRYAFTADKLEVVDGNTLRMYVNPAPTGSEEFSVHVETSV